MATLALVIYGLALFPRANSEQHPLRVSDSASANAPTGGVRDWTPRELPLHRAELQELLDFDDEDLAKNHAGNESFSQYPLGRLALVLVFGSVFALFGLVALREGWSPSTPKYRIGKVKPPDSRGVRIFMGLFGATLLAAGLGLFCLHHGIFQDVVVRRVCHVSGPLEFRTPWSKTEHKTWHFTINGTKVTLPRWTNEGSKLIRKGAPYRLHYLCHSGILVSIEPFVPTENSKGLPL